MSNNIYNNNVINKKFLNKEIKNKVLDSTFFFLKNNTNSLQFDQIKNLTLIIQKSMNNNKLTQNIITEQLENIKGLFNNDISKAKLLIHYIIIMSRHSSTNTTKINWFFYKDGVNKTKTINYFLENTNKENTKKSTQVLSEGLKIIHNIYINNKDSFDQLQLNSFNINDYTLNVNVDGYSVKLKDDPEKTYNNNQFMSLSYTLLNKDENEIKEIILAENILQHGVDISSHYLPQNSRYKLFRVNKNIDKTGIYAFDTKAIKSTLMWEKKIDTKEDPILLKFLNTQPKPIKKIFNFDTLNKSMNCSIYKITETKAMKLKYSIKSSILDKKESTAQTLLKKQAKIEELKEINDHFLTVKFKLSKLKIDKHFIFGLHNIKEKSTSDNIGFMMPIINELENDLTYSENLILFTQILKILNENGYCHPNLDQNVLIKDNFMPITFALDSKLKTDVTKDKFLIKDQWLYFYCKMDGEFQYLIDKLKNYYLDNKQAASDDPKFLQEHFSKLLNSLKVRPMY